MRIEIENWLKQAEADLKSSRNCISSGDYYLSVFSSQQSVEKALKTLSLVKLKEIIKGHSIIYLAQKLNIPKEMLSGIRDLNPEYLTTRYLIWQQEFQQNYTMKKLLKSIIRQQKRF